MRRCVIWKGGFSVSPQTVEMLKKQLLVRYAMGKSPKITLSSKEFIAMCCSATSEAYPDWSMAMTESEALDYLHRLHAARVVIHAKENDLVHLRPSAVINNLHGRIGLPQLDFAASDHRKAEALHEDIAAIEAQAAPVLKRTAAWRKRFWSTVALGSAAQMTFLSFLTFVKYDWDVMEPACFFLTSFTAILSYCYFVFFRREHTLAEVDANVLPRVFEAKLGKSSVNVDQWMKSLKDLSDTEKRVEEIGSPPRS